MDRSSHRPLRRPAQGGRPWIGLAASLVLFATLGGVGASVARAEDDVRAAAEAFDAGRRDYDKRRWEAAAANFESADESAPSARVLRMAIRSRTKAKQFDRAMTLAAQALVRYPNDRTTSALAKTTIDGHRSRYEKVTVTCGGSCQLTVNRRAVPGRARDAWVIFVPPGAATIAATFAGKRTANKSVTASKAGESSLAFEPPTPEPSSKPTPDPEPAAPNPSPVPKATDPKATDPKATEPNSDDSADAFKAYDPAKKGEKVGKAGSGNGGDGDTGGDGGPGFFESPAFFVTMAVVSVSAVGVTVWSGVDTLIVPGADEVREKCRGLGTDCPEYIEGQDSQLRTNILIGASAGVSAVTLLIGAFVTDWGGEDEPGDTAVMVTPWIPSTGANGAASLNAPAGAGFLVGGKF